MNDFNRCNKVSGVYWLKKDVRDLQIRMSTIHLPNLIKIHPVGLESRPTGWFLMKFIFWRLVCRIKLKPQDGIISLPKFEDCTKGTSILKLENTAEEVAFKWQEKLFSLWEVQRYTDIHNCLTDSELNYHEIIENMEYKPSKIFTYVNEDCYLPLPIDFKKKKGGLLNFNSYLEKLNLNDAVGRIFGGDTVSTTHLFKSEENVAIEKEEWTAMHVVFDNSDYNEDSNLIYKQEVTLLSIYHNTTHNYIVLMPDVNSMEMNPYCVETAAGVPWGFQYAVGIEFDDDCVEELVMLLKKLHKRWERKQRHLLNFVMPPVGKKQYYVTLEILTATEFDMDNLYIEFDIKVPQDVECIDALHGRTHTSDAATIKGDKQWSYGHIVELSLLVNTGIEPGPLKIFLEAISSDWWGRHRTEGYCYLPITLDPGCFSKKLACTRPEELDVVVAESRRFFLGGCHLIKDLNVLAEPQLQDANYTYKTTGTIKLRWTIISQAQVGSLSAPPPQPGTSTASALLLGAEAALKKYKKARARLAAATKDLSDVNYAGTG